MRQTRVSHTAVLPFGVSGFPLDSDVAGGGVWAGLAFPSVDAGGLLREERAVNHVAVLG